MYPGRVKFVQEWFKDATSVRYGYLLTGRPATAHDHLSGRRRSVRLPAEDIKEQSTHTRRHLRDVGERKKIRVVYADAGEKQKREIDESHHCQRWQRLLPLLHKLLQ